MEAMGLSPITLTEAMLAESIETITAIVGTRWISRRLQQAAARTKPRTLRTYSFLRPQPHHPLVELFLEFERWRETGARAEPAPAIVRIGLLAESLKLVRAQAGFDKLVQRLKKSSEFESAAFEVEVAASYLKRSWTVEFVETGDNRTPDLRVERGDGSPLWVECKRRDQLTKRDKLVKSIWDDLALSLLKEMGPRRLNYFVGVASTHDPQRRDVARLQHFILDSIESGGIGGFDPVSQTTKMVSDIDGEYEFVVQKLADPDETRIDYPVSTETITSFDVSKCGWEKSQDSLKQPIVRNPVFIGLKSHSLPDRVSGVVHALKAAVGQIPKDGSGVVWIRVPDNQWAYALDSSLGRVKELLQHELSGDQNRRINAVIVATGRFRNVRKDGLEALGYELLQVVIEHSNPRKPYVA